MADRLTSMAVFVKATDLGSFTAAAAALDLSPQMVGKHVALLEERLGTQLLRRTTRTQSLTAVGQAFYERCRTILAETEAAEALAHDLAATPRGRLRVNAPSTFGAVCLASVISVYLRQYPRVDLELVLEDRYIDLVEEGFDIALRLGPLRDSTLLSRTLPPMRLIVCGSPDYLARRGTPATPDDLAAHDCLGFVFSSGLTYSQWRFTKGGNIYDVEVNCRFRTNDSRVLLAAAVAGEGLVLQVDRVMSEDLAAGRLVQVLADFEGPLRDAHLIFSERRYQTPKLRTFIDHVVQSFAH